MKTSPLTTLLLTGLVCWCGAASGATTFLGGNLLDDANWSNGLPAGQDVAITEDGYYGGRNQDNPWMSGSMVSMDGDATLTLANDMAVKGGVFNMHSGTINCSDDFFAHGGTITIYDGTTTAMDDYEANADQGRIIIHGGTHSSGAGTGNNFGAQGSASKQGCGVDVLGGTVTAGTYRFQEYSINSLGGEAVLLSASPSTGLEMSGLMDIVGGWIGSWTVESFGPGDWSTELMGGGWALNGQSIDSTVFAESFAVSADGKTLSATGVFLTREEFALAAIRALEDHIDGTATLSATEIEAHKAAIDLNTELLADNDTVISACFDLVAAYDTVTGPLWADGSPIQKFLRSDTRDDDIDWVIFNVMQHLMDYAYTAENIARYETLIDGYKFGSSAHFPGAVAPPADPNVPYTVSISGSYLDSFGDDLFHADRAARKPTGTYLAPGSIATVTVPSSLVGKGYQVRVGAHYWDFSNKPWILRLDRVSLLYDIDNTEIKVANPLGGGIYIDVPYLADAGTVSVTIKNAVRSPYYSSKSFHTTTLSEWQNTERHHPGPWTDIQTDKFMLQLPTDWMYAMDDPQSIVDDWDDACDAMNDLMGHPLIHGKESYYAQTDLQIRSGAYSPGYPTVNSSYNPDSDYGGDRRSPSISDPRNAHDFVFHEQGHGYKFPKFSGEEESTVNLLHVAVWNRKYGYSMDEAFRSSRGFNDNEYRTLETTAMCWMMCENFMLEQPMEYHELIYQLKGHAKYVDMARLFGWDMLGDYWYSMNEDYENGNARPSGTDALILRMCETAGVDLRPLLQFWGIQQDDPATLATDIAAANLPVSAEIYNTLVRYKALIPANNAEFQTFASAWYEKEPDINSTYFVPMTEQYHASIWGSYDAAYAALINTNVQHIIDLYFPEGNPEPDSTPPSPNPMTWATPPTGASINSITMTATTATDVSGVEYYFTCTAGDGHNSGWQVSPSYTDIGLTPETTYTYTVTARDNSPDNYNETTASTEASATTPPVPTPIAGVDFENAANSAFDRSPDDLDPEDGITVSADWTYVGTSLTVKEDASANTAGATSGSYVGKLDKGTVGVGTMPATTPAEYYSWTITIPDDVVLNLTDITFDWRQGTGTTATRWAMFNTSLDGGPGSTAVWSMEDPPNRNEGWENVEVALVGSQYQGLTGTDVTFFWYNETTGSDIDTIVLSGSTGAYIPEIGDIDMEIVPGSSELAFSWYGEAGQTYGLEMTDNLVTGIWQTVTNVSGADEIISLTDDMDQTNAFYRVSLPE